MVTKESIIADLQTMLGRYKPSDYTQEYFEHQKETAEDIFRWVEERLREMYQPIKENDVIKEFEICIKVYNPILKQAGLTDYDIQSVLNMWKEPHRYYHTLEHMYDVLSYLSKQYKECKISAADYDKLVVAAFFHDAVYSPKSKNGDNETKSAALMLKMCVGLKDEIREEIFQVIMDTANHAFPSSTLSEAFISADLNILRKPLGVLLTFEKNIMREYQCYPYEQYRDGRLEALGDLLDICKSKYLGAGQYENVAKLREYVRAYVPNIGLYIGSFKPFHKGHENILHKAEHIFDKVIVVQGMNPDKKNTEVWGTLSQVLPYHETVTWYGLTTEILKSTNTTLIKGLRNGEDLAVEVNQLRFMEELYPQMKCVYLVCDKEFEHISSTAIRNLKEMGSTGKQLANRYLLPTNQLYLG